MRRALFAMMLAMTLAGCMHAVDPMAPGEQVALSHRRVKMMVRDGEGVRHALLVDVDTVGGGSVRGRIAKDAVETRGGLWAEVPPDRDVREIPFGDILEVQRGPTGEEIAAAMVAGCISGLCEGALNGAFR